MADNPLLGAGLGAVAGGALGAMASDDDENESESVEECDLIPEDDFFGEASSAKNLKMSVDDFFDAGVNESKKKDEDLDEGSLMTVEEFFKEAEMDEASKGKSTALGAAAGAGLGLALAALGGSNAGAPAATADAPVGDAAAASDVSTAADAPVAGAETAAGGEVSTDAITDPGTPEMSGDPETIRNLDNNFDPSASTATPDDNLDGLKNNPDNIDGELDDVTRA